MFIWTWKLIIKLIIFFTADGFRHRPDPIMSHHYHQNSRPASQQSNQIGNNKASSYLSSSGHRHRSRHIQGLPPPSVNGNHSNGIIGGVTGAGFSVYPHRDEVMLNEKYFPRDENFFMIGSASSQMDLSNSVDGPNDSDPPMAHRTHYKHPHLQIRGLSYQKPRPSASSSSAVSQLHLLDDISIEARAGEILGLLTTAGIVPFSMSWCVT